MKNTRTLRHLIAGASLVAFHLNLSAISVWINEIHYDNTGGDVGELVEIAGTSGTDLTAYSLYLYNGSNGVPYGTINLTGLLPSSPSGIGILSFLKAGIQNGAPDGLALADSSGVVQFISYEGVFNANDGVASGLPSTDIGVSETGSTSVGHSLQLTGTGSDYAAFDWTGPIAATPGLPNTGQTFLGSSVPDSGSSALMFILGLMGVVLYKRRQSNLNE